MPKIKNVGNILNYVFDGWKCRDFCAEAKGPDPTGLGFKCFDAVEECFKTRIDIDFDVTGSTGLDSGPNRMNHRDRPLGR